MEKPLCPDCGDHPNDKPLHVRVAEALGCEVEHRPEQSAENPWFCLDGCHQRHPNDGGHVLSYDLDWSAAGPLIERLHIQVAPPLPDSLARIQPHREWVARAHERENGSFGFGETGPSPLIAVCNLILALHKAGKLNQ